ncbi:sigma factor-like helix-turn-helix DNA-binding protein [Streptomyces sp. NPDC002232]|uniref:sigma factor-like helix-turn-helix DNA-binding protein n=1 Tax=Streptomyces sp. NPDC002232 TaxID=3364640 RepID=UPI0036AC41F5
MTGTDEEWDAMDDDTFLTALTRRFDAQEERLRAVALRITGSPARAEAALAAARAGLGRDGDAAVRAWLTATVGETCVRGLQGRGAGGGSGAGARGAGAGRGPGAREVGAGSGPGAGDGSGPGDGDGSPPGDGDGSGTEPGVGDGRGPGVGDGDVEALWLVLLVMLERLGGQERLAYVLHDAFGLPVPQTARILGSSPEAAARLAREARERIRGRGAVRTEGERGRQRAVVDRFVAAARARDARGLVSVLDPDVVAYADAGPVHGVAAVSETAAAFARSVDVSRPALVDGAVGAVGFAAGRPVSALAATLHRDRIVTLSVTTGEERVRALDLTFPDS